MNMRRYSPNHHSDKLPLSFWLLLILIMVAACSGRHRQAISPPSNQTTVNPPLLATDIWTSLLAKKAYPYNTPLPPQEPTQIDGIYEKFELKSTPPIPCRRCPDYMNEGGIWRLSLNSGTFHIFHVPTGWQGLGSYTVISDQLFLFNDPKCPETTGIYQWQLENGDLRLFIVEDDCAADLRGHNFAHLPWRLSVVP